MSSLSPADAMPPLASRRQLSRPTVSWYAATVVSNWLPLALAITLLCGIVYLSAQQMLRQAANDPQVQLAEDAAAGLLAGRPVDAVVPPGKVDIGAGLAPWVMVFDDAGRPLATSGELGSLPLPPSGVFEAARRSGQTRLTWQPAPGVRVAAVVQRYGGARPGFVVAGRSLRESEARTDQLLLLVVLAGCATLAATLAAVAGSVAFSARWLRPA